MSLHYTEKHISELLNELLQPESSQTAKEALIILGNIQACSNYVEEFVSLVLHPELNDAQKMMAILTVKQYLCSNRQFCINLNTISMIFSIFNNRQVTPALKCQILKIMCSTFPFARAREDIMQIILQNHSNRQIGKEDLYIFYISQYILKDDYHCTTQLNFILTINPLILQIAKKFIQLPHQNFSQEIVTQVLRIMKKISEKMKNVAYEQQLSYMNGNITDFLHEVLKIQYKNHQNVIKSACFELLDNIFTMVCQYLFCQEFKQIKSLINIQETLQLTIIFLKKRNQSKQNYSAQECVRLCLSIYKHFRFYSTLFLPDQQLMACLIGSISLKKMHYDHYYHNPQQFINFIRNLLTSQMNQVFVDNKAQNEEEYDNPKRYNAARQIYFTTEQNKRTQLQQKLNQYHYTTMLIEEICHKNELISMNLLQNIINVLYNGNQVNGLDISTSLILIGLLKKEVLKRNQIFSFVSQLLLNSLDSAAIPTSHTEQPQNIHYIILIAVCQRYLLQIFANCAQRQHILFEKLMKVLTIRKAEVSLVLLCMQVLEGFCHKADNALRIIDLTRIRLSSCENDVILGHFLSIYRSLMRGALYRADTCKQFHLAMLELIQLILKWQSSQNLQDAKVKAVSLLFDYKHYLLINKQQHQWKQDAYNQLLLQLYPLRGKISYKNKELVKQLDKQIIGSFNLMLQNSKYTFQIIMNAEQMSILDVLDYSINQKQCKFIPQLSKMLTILFQKLNQVSLQFVRRIYHLLNLLLADEMFKYSKKCLILVQSYLIIYHKHFSTEQIFSLCAFIQKIYFFGTQLCDPQLKTSKLIGEMIVYLCDNINEEKMWLKMLIENNSILNYTAWSNQVSIYLFSHILMKLSSKKDFQSIKKVFQLTIILLDCNIRQDFTSEMNIQQQEQIYSTPKQAKLSQIDEWSSFRQAISHLKDSDLWQYLKGHLCPKQQQILRRSFMCQSISQRTRVIVRTK